MSSCSLGVHRRESARIPEHIPISKRHRLIVCNGTCSATLATKSRVNEVQHTRKFEFLQLSSTSQVMLIFVHLLQASTIPSMLLVCRPMFLTAVRRPSAIWTLERNASRLTCVGVLVVFVVMRCRYPRGVLLRANRTWSQFLHSFTSLPNWWEWRVRERMK
jgi:hypothetical protein